MWYKRASQYDYYQDQIEKLGRLNPRPFNHWFNGRNRIYLDVNTSESMGGDTEIIDALAAKGYKIVDYAKGYCTSDGRRIIAIGKVLNNLHEKEKSNLLTKKNTMDAFAFTQEMHYIDRYYSQLKKIYETSHYRSAQSQNLMIVISQDPHDIAKMSTDRAWESCMTLGTGSEHRQVFCEVQSGGLIAYLIKKDDEDINKPLSRILIRHFKNNRNKSIAVAEKTVYGVDFKPFPQIVNRWLDQKQKMPQGAFRMQGGLYSDDLPHDLYLAPTNERDLMKWLDPENKEVSTWIYHVSDKIAEAYNNLAYYLQQPQKTEKYTFTSRRARDKFIQENENDRECRFELADIAAEIRDQELSEVVGEAEMADADHWLETASDGNGYHRKRFVTYKSQSKQYGDKRFAALQKILLETNKKFSPQLIETVRKILFEMRNTQNSRYDDARLQFAKKYPQSLTSENLQKLEAKNEEPLNLSPEQQQMLRQEQSRIILSKISNTDEYLYNIYPLIRKSRSQTNFIGERIIDDSHKLYATMYKDIAKPCISFIRPIPTDLVEKIILLVDTAIREMHIYGEKAASNTGEMQLKMQLAEIQYRKLLVDVFTQTRTDTPLVQNFYKSTIHNLEQMDMSNEKDVLLLSSLPRAIASLGSNSIQFLPFLRDKLSEAKKKYNDALAAFDESEFSDTSINRILKTAYDDVNTLHFYINEVEKYQKT